MMADGCFALQTIFHSVPLEYDDIAMHTRQQRENTIIREIEWMHRDFESSTVASHPYRFVRRKTISHQIATDEERNRIECEMKYYGRVRL